MKVAASAKTLLMVVCRSVERMLELVVPVKDATHSWPTVTYVYILLFKAVQWMREYISAGSKCLLKRANLPHEKMQKMKKAQLKHF